MTAMMTKSVPLLVPYHVGERVEGFASPPGGAVLDVALPAGSASERMLVLFRELSDLVAAGRHSLIYTGDCMAPLGVLAGLHRRGISPVIVWLDAHGDFNTWETTPSGYIGGMPLAMIAGRGNASIVDGLGLPAVDPTRVFLTDARDVDPEEGRALDGSGVRVGTVEETSQRIATDPSDSPIYVHLDVDVVDPGEIPALRFPAARGPSLARVEALLLRLSETGRVVCVTIGCTWDPAHHEAGKAQEAADRLAGAAVRALPAARPSGNA